MVKKFIGCALVFLKIFLFISTSIIILSFVYGLITNKKGLNDLYHFLNIPFVLSFSLVWTLANIKRYIKHIEVLEFSSIERALKLKNDIKQILLKKHWKIVSEGEMSSKYWLPWVRSLWGESIAVEIDDFNVMISGAKQHVQMILEHTNCA